MIYKKRILFTVVFTTLLGGCGEELSVGVTKGGSGNGKPNSDIDIVVERFPLDEHYSIWLSKPHKDYCQSVERTLQFLDPITFEVVDEDQFIEIEPNDEIENQLILQIRWQNQSDHPKTVLHPTCDYLVELKELGEETPLRTMRCDIEKITVLDKNDVYIYEKAYNFSHTSRGILKHSLSIQFLPSQKGDVDCGKLNIPYEIQNLSK